LYVPINVSFQSAQLPYTSYVCWICIWLSHCI
jgi:hypothetical protein